LGGKEKSTLKEISELLGKETIDLYTAIQSQPFLPMFFVQDALPLVRL